MATKKEGEGLELGHDGKFLDRSWRIQRIGWITMILVAVAAVMGVFGGGPVSSASAGAAESGLQVQYERFARMLSDTRVRVRATPAAVGDSVIAIWVSDDWIGRFDVESINPEPDRTTARGRGRTYEFAAADTGSVEVVFKLKPTNMGPTTGMISLIGGSSATIRQFIYP